VSPEYLPIWLLLSGLGVVVAAALLLPAPPVRPGKNSIGYWPLVLIMLMGVIGVAGPWYNIKMTPIAYEAMAIGLFFLLRHYGDARSDYASKLWLAGSQIAFVLLYLMSRGSLGEPAFSWVMLAVLFLILPVWPLSFWWGETISQSPLPVAVLLPAASLTLPGWMLGLVFLREDAGGFFPGDMLWLPILISLLIAALALGRQSDLKLSLAFGIWVWVLALSLRPLLEAPDQFIHYYHQLYVGHEEEFTNNILPFYKNSVVHPAVSLSLLLIVAAFATLIAHLKRCTGSTFVEDFTPLAENPRLARFRLCWTFATWLLAALPLSFLWQSVASGYRWDEHFFTATVPVAIALVPLAGSLFHLRNRLFHGDAHTNAGKVVHELPFLQYVLILFLLGSAACLPFLLESDADDMEEAIIYIQGAAPAETMPATAPESTEPAANQPPAGE